MPKKSFGKKSHQGGIRVGTHATNRFRERVKHPKANKLTALEVKRVVRELVRSGKDIEPNEHYKLPKMVRTEYSYGKGYTGVVCVLMGHSKNLNEDWDVITILTEEQFLNPNFRD